MALSQKFMLGLAAALMLLSSPDALAKRRKVEAPVVRPVDLDALETALDQKRLVQARTMIEQAALAQQKGERLALLEAEFHLESGQVDQAMAGFRLLLEGPHAARAAQGLGIGLLRQHQTAEALAHLQAAVAREPELWRAWNAQGVAHDRQGQWPEAEAAYARALALKPMSAEVLSNRGYSRLLQRRAEEAVADLEMAAALLPASETVRTNLQLALAMAGRYEAAITEGAATGSTAKAGPPQAEARQFNNVGYAALLRGDREAARALLSRALELSDVYYGLAAANLALAEGEALRP